MTAATDRHLVEAAFDQVEDVRAVVEAALESGVAASRVEVRSPAPLEDDELPLPKPKSRVLLFALAGAVLGGLTPSVWQPGPPSRTRCRPAACRSSPVRRSVS